VGTALEGRRDDVVLATEARLPMGDDHNQQGASRRWLLRAVEDSLGRLRTDHIDLFQLHRPDADTDIEETLSALSDLIHTAKVRGSPTTSSIGSTRLPRPELMSARVTGPQTCPRPSSTQPSAVGTERTGRRLSCVPSVPPRRARPPEPAMPRERSTKHDHPTRKGPIT
jgi:hypothetical protein